MDQMCYGCFYAHALTFANLIVNLIKEFNSGPLERDYGLTPLVFW
jgi:hypothetical protein